MNPERDESARTDPLIEEIRTKLLALRDTDGTKVTRDVYRGSDLYHGARIDEAPDLVRQSRAAGCHYFLRKPYDPNALLTLIRQAIRDATEWPGPANG